MKRLGGPELKMPEVKTPQFLADLYYDLRDRRLLPVVALVVVAIAAVPFLLGGSEEPLPSTTPEEAAERARLEIVNRSGLAVVQAKPPLRDYKKRLKGRTSSDPFMQRYTGLPEEVQLESTDVSSVSVTGGEGGGAPDGTVGVVEEGGAGEEAAPEGAPDAAPDAEDPVRLYELVIDVQVQRIHKTADGREERGDLQVRRRVPVVTQLPGKKNPVVTTMGANFERERLYFLVSREVEAIVGEFSCVTRADVCELLEVAPGILLEYVLASGDRYTFKVTGIDAIPAREDRARRSARAAFTAPLPGLAWKIPQSFSK